MLQIGLIQSKWIVFGLDWATSHGFGYGSNFFHGLNLDWIGRLVMDLDLDQIFAMYWIGEVLMDLDYNSTFY